MGFLYNPSPPLWRQFARDPPPCRGGEFPCDPPRGQERVGCEELPNPHDLLHMAGGGGRMDGGSRVTTCRGGQPPRDLPAGWGVQDLPSVVDHRGSHHLGRVGVPYKPPPRGWGGSSGNPHPPPAEGIFPHRYPSFFLFSFFSSF